MPAKAKSQKTPSLQQLKSDLYALENPARAHFQQGFFKCGKGEYAEGDVMLGIPVPVQRKVGKKYSGLALAEVKRLLSSREHEFRFVALVILAAQYAKSDAAGKKYIAKFYLNNVRYINNWDLVDTSAPQIIGDYFFNHDQRGGAALFRKFARSQNLWERRIAIVATQYFIRMNSHDLTLEIAEMLLDDKHDLIHKASGWMLREVGIRDVKLLEKFLAKHKAQMPRTMLRYAIERFPEARRREYLGK
jgi:3-methyladenine DNA glycosylase AlkD